MGFCGGDNDENDYEIGFREGRATGFREGMVVGAAIIGWGEALRATYTRAGKEGAFNAYGGHCCYDGYSASYARWMP